MQDTRELWDKCLGIIELEVSKPNFSTWFKNTSLVKEEGGVVFVGVPNEFVKDWLINKYQKLITKTLCTFVEHVRSVEFVITKHEIRGQELTQPIQKTTVNRELPLQDLYINKDDNLNPRYTFDTFVVGPFNELAYAAAQAIIKSPGSNYNPFFVYGNTGLGKTHLIQGIGNAVKTRFPDKKIFYITLEKFATDLVSSYQTNKANTFKEKYRKYDLMIIDDIQFVGKMEKIQEELFHLFNTFYESNHQIIFSSDKHPNFIPGLEDRLRSRFQQGMIVDVIEPDFESRVAILRAKAKQHGIIIPEEITEYVATVVQGSIRELEGSLNTVICQMELKNRTLTLAETKNLLKNSLKPKKNIAVGDVVKHVAEYYNLDESTVYDKSRRKEIVKARQIVMYILREEFNVSYPLIGQKLGGKDHTTVIHSYEKIKNDLKNDPSLVEELEEIKRLCK